MKDLRFTALDNPLSLSLDRTMVDLRPVFNRAKGYLLSNQGRSTVDQQHDHSSPNRRDYMAANLTAAALFHAGDGHSAVEAPNPAGY